MEFPHPTEIGAHRRRIIYAVAFLLLVGGGIVYSCLPNGPFYRGRSLDAWLDDYANPMAHVRSLADLQSTDIRGQMKAAEEAVNAIGTNAIPTLLKYIEARDSGLKKMLLSAGKNAPLVHNLSWTEDNKHAAAQAGFMILGQRAACATPALIELTRRKDAATRIRACETLYFITADLKSLEPVLMTFAHDPDAGNRQAASRHMQSMLPLLSSEEIQKAGIYDAFPELRPVTAGAK
jgi:hypothetical protein